jgi:hypothetical protein
MVVYGVAAIGVFLVVLWVTRRGFAAPESEPPRQWRLAGWMIWLSLLFGGFSGVSQLTSPLLSSLSTSTQQLVSGAVLGGVVALVVRLGASIALHADMDMLKWGVLYQVIALGGLLVTAGATGITAYAALAVIPAYGLVTLLLAFRTPPRHPGSQPAAPPRSKRT